MLGNRFRKGTGCDTVLLRSPYEEDKVRKSIWQDGNAMLVDTNLQANSNRMHVQDAEYRNPG
jgi:hypothetical protein